MLILQFATMAEVMAEVARRPIHLCQMMTSTGTAVDRLHHWIMPLAESHHRKLTDVSLLQRALSKAKKVGDLKKKIFVTPGLFRMHATNVIFEIHMYGSKINKFQSLSL